MPLPSAIPFVRRAAGLALAVFLSAGPGGAATLGLPTRPAPEIAGPGLAFHEPGFGLFLQGEAAVGTAPLSLSGLSVLVPYADPVAVIGALFVIDATGAEVLSGDLVAAGAVTGPGTDRIELLFDNLSGPAAGLYDLGALLLLTGEFGEDPFGAGFGGFLSEVTVDYAIRPVAPVPLPAGGVALASALALLAWRRKS